MRQLRTPEWAREADSFVRANTTPMVRLLIYINAGLFIVLNLLFALAVPSWWGDRFFEVFSCNELAIRRGFIWQFVTYMFLHGSLGHVFFNMLMLWFFGPFVEREFGSKLFLRFYLLCGIGAAVLYELILLATAEGRPSQMIGSSGAVYGIALAVGYWFPQMTVLLMGIVPMQMRVLVIIFVVLSFMGSIQPGSDNVAHLCHLTGMGVAYGLLKWNGWRGRPAPEPVRRGYYRG